MVQLTCFRLQNYRAFREPIQVDLRKLNVVFGRNSAGKSALVRFPPLLQRSMNLPYEGLCCEAEDPSGVCPPTAFEFIHGGAGVLAAEVRGTLGGEGKAGEEFSLKFEGAVQGTHLKLSRWSWEGRAGMTRLDPAQPMAFRGLLPWSPTPPVPSPAEVGTFVTHLAGLRPRPRRSWARPATADDGEWAFLLAEDASLQASVATWFKTNLGWDLRVEEHPYGSIPGLAPAFSLVLRRRDGPWRNLADLGTGMHQLLPVVVSVLAPGWANRLLALEEPESHLHPGAHAQVADLLLNAAKDRPGPLLVETHSEMLLLRLRRRVVEEPALAGLVQVYFVDDFDHQTSLRALTIDQWGRLPDWPASVFDEEVEERRAINLALAKREE